MQSIYMEGSEDGKQETATRNLEAWIYVQTAASSIIIASAIILQTYTCTKIISKCIQVRPCMTMLMMPECWRRVFLLPGAYVGVH